MGKKKDAAAKSAEAKESKITGEAETTVEKKPAQEPLPPEIQAMVNDLADKHLRAKAELDNYRKRVQRDFSEIRQQTKSSTIQEFFTVFDHFQMAMDHADENADVATLKQGMDMILAEFKRTFENLGVEQITAAGKPFDPSEHEAVSQEPSDEVAEGIVIRQWKNGYRMGERLLRPATVVVSSGPAASDDNDNDDDS
jgi:molecular chaperone GrpE